MNQYKIIPRDLSYGKEAKHNIKNNIGLPLASNNISFQRFEIQSKNNSKINFKTFSISELDNWNHRHLPKTLIENILKKISMKPKTFMNMKNKSFYILGVLNLTPNSFSNNNNKIPSHLESIKKAIKMCEDGADIIDIGGESSKPGALSINESEEQRRIIPVIKELSKMNITISCDTKNANTMKKAIDAGAKIINDVSALKDKKAAKIISKNKVGIILMHMQGKPLNMQTKPTYKNVSLEILDFLDEKKRYAINNGVKENYILIDPGIGFGKNDMHNIKIFKDLSLLHSLNSDILIGASRKSMIGRLTESAIENRLPGSISLTISSMTKGVKFFRVHDVKETFQALSIWDKIINK